MIKCYMMYYTTELTVMEYILKTNVMFSKIVLRTKRRDAL